MERANLKVRDLEITLRPCIDSDIGFVYELMHYNLAGFFDSFTEEKWSRAKFRKGFSTDTIIIFEHEKMPIGFAYLDEKNEGEIYCGGFHLSKDYQNKKLGTFILEHILKDLSGSGVKYFSGKIFKENKRSLSFIMKLGFFIEADIPEENSYFVRRSLIL